MTRRSPFRLLALVLPVALLAGCIRWGTLPSRELYRLSPSDSLVRRLVAPGSRPTGERQGGGEGEVLRAALPGTIAILPYVTPGLYGDQGIVYRIGDTEYGVYPAREWAIPLGEMLGQLTAELATGAGLSRETPLYQPPSPRSHTYLWRATVREFEEVNRGRVLSAAVRIDASLVRTADDSVVWSASAARERAVAGTTMPDVVGTLSAIAAETIAELLARAERDLAGSAATPARRSP